MQEFIIIQRDELSKLIRTSLQEILSEKPIKNEPSRTAFLDLKEAADFLKVKVTTIYGYTSQSRIPFIKRGKKLYFEKEALEMWLQDGRKESINDIKKRLGGYTK